MISCRKVKKWMVDYLEGTLPGEKKALFAEHLAKCPRCAQEVTTLVKTQKLVEMKATEEMPEEFWTHYLPRLKRRLAEKPLPGLQWRPVPTLALATVTALVLLIVVTVSLFRSPSLDLKNLPREVLAKEMVTSNSEVDYFIAESFEPEEIVQALMPQEIFSTLAKGGEMYEVL